MMRMKKMLIGLMAPIAVEACVPAIAVAPAPAVLADTTTFDEQGALMIEVAYLGAGALLEAAVSTGRLRGAAAARANEIDAQAARYVGLARAAYDAGNADDLATALKHARPMVAELRRIVEAGR